MLFGESAQVTGRLVNAAGGGIAGAEVQVLATTPFGQEQLVAVVQTTARGAIAGRPLARQIAHCVSFTPGRRSFCRRKANSP